MATATSMDPVNIWEPPEPTCREATPWEMMNATAAATAPMGANTPAISPPRPYAPERYESPAVASPCIAPAATPATAPPEMPPARAQHSTSSTISMRPTDTPIMFTSEKASSSIPTLTDTAAMSPVSKTAALAQDRSCPSAPRPVRRLTLLLRK